MRDCTLGGKWTPATRTGPEAGCTCRPTFYVVVHHGSRLVRERVGKNRRQAERLRHKREVEVAEGGYQPVRRIRFADWGPKWLGMLERKGSTVASYRSTIRYASDA